MSHSDLDPRRSVTDTVDLGFETLGQDGMLQLPSAYKDLRILRMDLQP